MTLHALAVFDLGFGYLSVPSLLGSSSGAGCRSAGRYVHDIACIGGLRFGFRLFDCSVSPWVILWGWLQERRTICTLRDRRSGCMVPC
jgi:hypothetical protein